MLKLLFSDEPVEFSFDVPDIVWLHSHGVIEEIDGLVAIIVPLYAKRLVNAFRPLLNGETRFYITSPDDLAVGFQTADGTWTSTPF